MKDVVIFAELEYYNSMGIGIRLNGLPVEPLEAADTLTQYEKEFFMRDFIFNEGSGCLQEVRFDRIK